MKCQQETELDRRDMVHGQAGEWATAVATTPLAGPTGAQAAGPTAEAAGDSAVAAVVGAALALAGAAVAGGIGTGTMPPGCPAGRAASGLQASGILRQ